MNLTRHVITRRRLGFTLMELLIAVAIFAIVLAAINTVFFAALRLRNRFTTIFDEQLPLVHATDVIKRDLASIVSPSTNATADSTNITYFGPLTTGVTSPSDGSAAMAQPNVTEFYVSSGIVDDNLPWGDMQKVSYLLLPPTNQDAAIGKDLIRSVTRNIAPAIGTDQPEKQLLMQNVEAITFSFYDGTQWAETWDTSTVSLTTGLSNTLPRAIKVVIQLAGPRNVQAPSPVELVVPIFTQTRTNSQISTNS